MTASARCPVEFQANAVATGKRTDHVEANSAKSFLTMSPPKPVGEGVGITSDAQRISPGPHLNTPFPDFIQQISSLNTVLLRAGRCRLLTTAFFIGNGRSPPMGAQLP